MSNVNDSKLLTQQFLFTVSLQSTLPEQLIALFMDHYRGLDPQGRLHLFRTLTADFDVQHRDVGECQLAMAGGRLGAGAVVWPVLTCCGACAGLRKPCKGGSD